MRRDRSLRAGLVALVSAALLALAAAGAAVAVAAVEPPPAGFAPCSNQHDDRSQCGQVVVPLDRSGAVPGAVALHVRLLPASRGTTAGTVIALAGGPGQAAAPLLEDFADALGSVLGTRQLVTFDQRGTGGSGRLACPSLTGSGPLAALVAACARRLGPARSAYTTAASVADLEAVRAAVGADRVILYGTSYGTKVALAYAAAYPQHVDKLVLDSPVPADGLDPFERTATGSIPRVLRTVCRHACPFTHDDAADLARLVGRVARRPLRGVAFDGRGRAHRGTVGPDDLLALVRASDLDPFERSALPAAIHAGLLGDAAPLARLDWQLISTETGSGKLHGDAAPPARPGDVAPPARLAWEQTDHGPADPLDSDALFLTTTCEDGGVPWPAGTPVAARAAAVDAALRGIPARAFAPFGAAVVRRAGVIDLCRAWPESPIVQPRDPLPAVPTLILSGDDDLRTPRADARALAAALPDARLIEVPDTGHSTLGSDFGDCASDAVTAFLAGLTPKVCPVSRTSTLPPAAAAPTRLADVPARPGVRASTRVLRTLTAVNLTLADFNFQLTAAILSGNVGSSLDAGGLRGGYGWVDKNGMTLRDYEYVPGVTVSVSRAKPTGRIALRIGGRAAAHGRLVLATKTVDGILDGQRIHIVRRTTASARSAAAGRAVAGAAAWAFGALPGQFAPGPGPRAPALARP